MIPEDRADAQFANGFVEHNQVKARNIQVMPPAGGWSYVLKTFVDEYIAYLRNYPTGYVILLVDFDGQYEDRRLKFSEAIPMDLRERVFVLGAASTPESLKNELHMSFDRIGASLAEDCHRGIMDLWQGNQLAHNEPDRRRLFESVRPILFGL